MSRLRIECDYPGCDEKWVLEFPASSATPPDDGWVLFCPHHAHFAQLDQLEGPERQARA